MPMVFILCLIIIKSYDCFHNFTRNLDNPRLARRARSLKAEAVARLECLAETPLAYFGVGERHDSATGPEDTVLWYRLIKDSYEH
jgi:hypothetical protein